MNNKNASEPVNPVMGMDAIHHLGLTKREWFAGMAMQGLAAANKQVEYGDRGFKRDLGSNELIKDAIQLADCMLDQLAKDEQQPGNKQSKDWVDEQ